MPQSVFAKLIQWAAECKDIDFSREREHFQNGSGDEPRLKAGDLRRVLLGRPDSSDSPGFDPAQVHRWQISGVTIEGSLDLRDARLPSGSPLPSLEFLDCTFEEGIWADGAHLERLHLSNCVLGSPPGERRAELSLRSARVESEVRLSSLSSTYLAPSAVLRVDANAIKVGSNFVLKRSVLRAPINRDELEPLKLLYALNLRNAEIGANLLLQPDLTLHGGLVAVSAHVGGEVRAGGLIADDGYTPDFRARQRELKVRYRSAFSLAGAKIDGNVYIYTFSSGNISNFGGELDMSGLHCEGALSFLGITMDATFCEPTTAGGAVALNLALANIKGPVSFSPVFRIQESQVSESDAEAPVGPAEVQVEIRGLLEAAGASIEGKLWISGNISSISALGISVTGGLQISTKLPVIAGGQTTRQQGESAYGYVNLSGATIKAGFYCEVNYAFDSQEPVRKQDQTGLKLTNANIAGGLTVTGVYNSLEVDRAFIDGQLWISGNIPSITATEISIVGGLQLHTKLSVLASEQATSQRGESAYGYANFSGATIKAGVYSDVSYAYDSWKPLWKQDQQYTGLNLASAIITGSLTVTGVYNFIVADNLKLEGDSVFRAQVFYRLQLGKAQLNGDCDLSGFRFYPWMLRRDTTLSPVLSMQDADVKRTLRLNRWSDLKSEKAVEFLEARECRPRCYPDLRIVEIKARRNKEVSPAEEFWTPFIVFPRRIANVLTRSQVLHAINGRRYLHLGSDEENYRDYLRLFCAYVWGDEGAFAITEPTLDGKQPYTNDDVDEGSLPEIKLIEVDIEPALARAKAYVRYAGWIFSAEFVVWKTGLVEMKNDKSVCKLKPGVVPKYDPQSVAVSGTDKSDYHQLNLEGQKKDLEWLEEVIPDWKRPLFPDTVYFGAALIC
jgi:hypothetical protein